MSHIIGRLNDAPLGLASWVVTHDAVAHGHRDTDVRLDRLGDQQHEIVTARFCRNGGQMAAGQIPVPLHTSVLYAAVDSRANPQPTRPVQRRERRLEAG